MKRLTILLLSFYIIASIYAQEDTDSSGLKLVLPVGHTGEVYSAEFSPNGKLILTASEDGTAIIWDVETGKQLHCLKSHRYSISSFSFSTDGKKIVTASRDKTAKIWDVKTGKLLYTLKGHSKGLRDVSYSPDGKKIVTASADKTAKIWNAETGKVLHSLKGHTAPINKALFSPDDKKIVTASSDKTVRIWDAETGKLLHVLEGHSNEVSTVSLSPVGNTIASVALYDKKVGIWDTQTGELIYYLDDDELTSFPEAVSFSPDGKKIATADHSVRIWDGANGKLICRSLCHYESIYSVSFSPDSRKVLTASYDKTAKILDAETGEVLYVLEGHFGLVWSASFCSNAKKVVTASYDKTARIWDANTGELLHVLKGHSNHMNSVSFSPDKEKIVTTSEDKTARIWDAKTVDQLICLKDHNNVVSASFSPDRKRILTTYDDNQVKLYDSNSGELIHTLEEDFAYARSSFSSTGEKVLTIDWYRMAPRIWDAKTGKLLHTLIGHSAPINEASFSPDDKKIVTASKDNTAIIWNTETGKVINILNSHKSAILDVSFSPDGNEIITASYDKSAKIWDANTGELLSTLKRHTAPINKVSFSPDGKKVVTAFSDSTAIIWDTKTAEVIHILKSQDRVIYDVSFSPDSKKIITASADDYIVRIWNADKGILIGEFKGTFGDVDWKNNRLITKQNESIFFYDLVSNKKLFTLVPIDSSDYLIYDEYYRFDGTENARKSLYFTCGLDVIELEQVKDQLWIPNLAERIMKGESINSPKLEDLDLCNLIPEVENLETNNNIYSFFIKPRRGGLGESVLYVNNLEVKRFSTGQLKKQDGGFILQVPVREVEPYFIPGERNTVSVKAYTTDNTIISRGAKTLSEDDNLKKQPPEIYAVVVGVSDYKGEELDLRYPAKDAKKISAILESASSKLFSYDGLDRTHLYLLQTDADRSAFPDKKSIKDTFTKIGKTAKSNDVLLIFFAGHGEVNKKDQQFYFLTADASDNSLPETVGISTKELFEWIQPANIKAQNRVLILDACNSGQAIKDIIKIGDANQRYMAARDDEYARYRKELDKLNDNSGLFILSASASTQSAYEMNKYNQGILTYALLKPLKENPNILDTDNLLSVSRWFDAAKDIVDGISTTNGFRQQPQLLSSTNFKIGVVDDEVRSKITLPKEKPTFEAANFLYKNVPVDQIDFSKVVNDELNSIANENLDSPFIYFANNRSSESIKLSGNYLANDENITIYVYMSRNNRIIDRFEQSGPKKDLKKLAQQIIDEALLRLRK